MALLIYTEMAWVIASPSYLCSHTNEGVTYLPLQTSTQMRVYVNYINYVLNGDELINHLVIEPILT